MLDTHALVWWLAEPGRLTRKARAAIDDRGPEPVRVSVISAWEIAMLTERGRLELDRDPGVWLDAVADLPLVAFEPISLAIAVAAVRLPEPLHRDPADRIIAATTMALGATLVTADRRLRDYASLRTVW